MRREAVTGRCSRCLKKTRLAILTKEEILKVRKEPIKVKLQYTRCTECGDEVFNTGLNPDPFNLAYREYRARHSFLQPEEIRGWRKNYNLTQGEVARLLGLGTATISRYENGSLQDESHDKLLSLMRDPANLLTLVQQSENVFSEAKKTRLLNTLKVVHAISHAIDDTIRLNFGSYEPDEFSGYKRLDLAKLYNAILFFCRDGVLKTKLNKLLFYVDFKHFKEYTVSVTGARYAHIPFGPVPDNYEIFLGALHAQKAIESIEEFYQSGYSGEIIKARKQADLNIFSPSELRVMASVAEDFGKYGAKEITELSHREEAYRQTENGDIISYKYANHLNY